MRSATIQFLCPLGRDLPAATTYIIKKNIANLIWNMVVIIVKTKLLVPQMKNSDDIIFNKKIPEASNKSLFDFFLSIYPLNLLIFGFKIMIANDKTR
jgi:hypothetical protein